MWHSCQTPKQQTLMYVHQVPDYSKRDYCNNLHDIYVCMHVCMYVCTLFSRINTFYCDEISNKRHVPDHNNYVVIAFYLSNKSHHFPLISDAATLAHGFIVGFGALPQQAAQLLVVYIENYFAAVTRSGSAYSQSEYTCPWINSCCCTPECLAYGGHNMIASWSYCNKARGRR